MPGARMACGLENRERTGAPDSGFAIDDDVAPARNVVEAGGQRRERNVYSRRERPLRDLERLSHVEKKRCFAYAQREPPRQRLRRRLREGRRRTPRAKGLGVGEAFCAGRPACLLY